MKELPRVYDPKKVESKVYALWEKSGFFNPDKLPKTHKKPFSIVIPPPNITGSLHMGHALNTTIQDILIRQKRMRGYKTLWLPGTDHAGIATQNVVEKELKREGLSRHDIGREKFIERVWQWKERYGNIILDQLKKLGASCDWSKTRFTMDEDYQRAVKKAFLHYYKKGWIYQGERTINWCPRCQTSLSDLEIEYEEEQSNLWYIRYPLKNTQINTNKNFTPEPRRRTPIAEQSSLRGAASTLRGRQAWYGAGANQRKFIVVATTRPETMLGDSAVAVNPGDKRYKNLVGKMVILPIQNREIPIIADPLIDSEFGTGAVKVTPSHDLTDFEIGLSHRLKSYKVINEAGRMTGEAGENYEGLNIPECRQKVIEELTRSDLVEKIEPYSHRIAKCSRCGKTIEPLPSKQWFLKMEKLAKMAISACKSRQVKFIPKKWEKLYFNWLENIKDWCISRQIWWGHALPIWYCQIGKKSKIKNKKSKINRNKERYFISLEKPEKCPICGKCQPEQSADVLDTWFSSALWPFATLGWPIACAQNKKLKIKNKKSDIERFYPTDVLVTARDIINLWVARMIFSGFEFMKEKPFEEVYIHAIILTKEGKRMSKSKGTGIDPLSLIEKYGADATRFGIIWQETGSQDIHFGEEPIIAGKKFCNKLWNASRFVLQQISKSKIKNQKLNKNKLTQADRRILSKLNKVVDSVGNDLENYQFGKALRNLYDFFWHEFCDLYIEESKKQNDEKSRRILLYVLLSSLKLLHPFVPFVSEEIYQKLPKSHKKKSLMIEQWPSAPPLDRARRARSSNGVAKIKNQI